MTSPSILPPPDPSLTLVATDQRLSGLGVIAHAKPLVLLVIVLLLVAIVAAAVLWIVQATRPASRGGPATAWLSAIAAGAPMLGLAAAAYGLMDACIGIANVRPVPTLSILAPGPAEAFFCITLGCLASAIASVGGKHLQGRLQALEATPPAERPAPSVLARTTA